MEKIEIYSEKLEAQVSVSTESVQTAEIVGWMNSGWQRN